MRSDVVALYVDRLGPYPRLVEEWYDETRDALTYHGNLPVVAHPPCAPWSRLKHLNRYQKKEHAIHAVETVQRVGGVLEHPHGSQLWKHCGLPKPGEGAVVGRDAWGFTIEVEQVRWGHVATKRTWLYVVCLSYDPTLSNHILRQPPPRKPTHWASGGRKPRATGQTLVPPGIKVCSATQRRRTPPAFAEWLLELAARCRRV